jgi:hypothetical protein
MSHLFGHQNRKDDLTETQELEQMMDAERKKLRLMFGRKLDAAEARHQRQVERHTEAVLDKTLYSDVQA